MNTCLGNDGRASVLDRRDRARGTNCNIIQFQPQSEGAPALPFCRLGIWRILKRPGKGRRKKNLGTEEEEQHKAEGDDNLMS